MPAPISAALQSTSWKFSSTTKLNAKKNPNKRPKNLQRLTYGDENSTNSTFVKELKRQA